MLQVVKFCCCFISCSFCFPFCIFWGFLQLISWDLSLKSLSQWVSLVVFFRQRGFQSVHQCVHVSMCSRCVCVWKYVSVCVCVCVLMRVDELISLNLLALQCGTLSCLLLLKLRLPCSVSFPLSKIGLTIVCVSSVRYVSGNPRTVLLRFCLRLRLRLCLPFSVFTFNYIRRALTRDFFHLPWNRALLLSLSLSRLASSRLVFVCVFFFFWLPPRITFYLRILCLSVLFCFVCLFASSFFAN